MIQSLSSLKKTFRNGKTEPLQIFPNVFPALMLCSVGEDVPSMLIIMQDLLTALIVVDSRLFSSTR